MLLKVETLDLQNYTFNDGKTTSHKTYVVSPCEIEEQLLSIYRIE